MTWTGYVSGSATLYVQGNHVDVQGRDTGAVDRPNAQFFSPLPATRTRVDIQVRRGRGRVNLVEQPLPDNQYAAIVQIDPPGRQPEFYTIDFYWDRDNNRSSWQHRGRDFDRDGIPDRLEARNRTDSARSGELRWSGVVDDEVLIEVQGRRAYSRVVRGAPISGERYDMTSAVPRDAGVLRLEDAQGRGRIEIVQRPDARNDYTAVVRISDEDGGRAPYSFRLVWDESYASGYGYGSPGSGVLSPGRGYSGYGYRGRTQDSPYSSGYARWSAQVDDRVHVTIQGNRATVSTVAGRPVANMNIDFHGGSGVPDRGVSDLQMRKLQGRGEVRVIHAPDPRDSSLVFEVNDDDGGSDFYEIEFTWR
jgi:hypothetical protein